MNTKRHFIFTRNAKTDRNYGGENYSLTVYEVIKRGDLRLLGAVSKNTRSHKGEVHEAFSFAWDSAFTTRQRKAMLKKATANGCRAYGFPAYLGHVMAEKLGIKCEQI